MSVVGKASVSVVGACTDVHDTTMGSLMAQSVEDQEDEPENIFDFMHQPTTMTHPDPPSTSTVTLSHDCCCDEELRALKKRKLYLQIELLERKLKK